MPDIPLKSLTITFENLQDVYNTSYHLFIASLETTSVGEINPYEPEIYPVPATDCIWIKTTHSYMHDFVVDILNAAGKVLIHKQVAESGDEVKLNISSLPAGVYFCRICLSNSMFMNKLIKL
jgi:hypothetical protein